MAEKSASPSSATLNEKMDNSTIKDASRDEEKYSGRASLDRSSSQNESLRGSIVAMQAGTEKDIEKADPASPPVPVKGGINPADFPDGGLEAWLVVLGGWCCLFCRLR